jgi:hypothetical protein
MPHTIADCHVGAANRTAARLDREFEKPRAQPNHAHRPPPAMTAPASALSHSLDFQHGRRDPARASNFPETLLAIAGHDLRQPLQIITSAHDVHDTGAGIRPEALGRIFEAFERSDDTRPDGLGLGLFIAKRAAGLLGHRLEIRSAAGRGSCFTVVARVAGKPPRNQRLTLAAVPAAQRLNLISCTGEAGATGR